MAGISLTHLCKGFGDTPCPGEMQLYRKLRCRPCMDKQRKIDQRRWNDERAAREALNPEVKALPAPHEAGPSHLTKEIDRVLKFML